MKHLSASEKDQIELLLNQEYSKRAIAKVLQRNPDTVCEEVKKNSVKWKYIAKKAIHKAYVRRLYCKKELKKIRINDDLENFVREKIKDDRSPEIVAYVRNSLHKEWSHISAPTIRKYIDSCFWYWLTEHLYSNRHHRKRRYRKTKKEIIKNRVFISYRPEIIEKLVEFGHYESDLIVGPMWSKECLVVLIEKMTRFKLAIKVDSKSPKIVTEVLKYYVKRLWIKSITFDNWVEFQWHLELWVPTYFCNPHHPREKWQVERWNRDIRRYFPKGTNFKNVTQKEIDIIVKKINNRPMKCLGYQSSVNMFEKYFSQVSVLTL